METKLRSNIHDYAVSVVPEHHRKWQWISVTNVLIGVATAMFFMAWGGELTKSYGTIVTIIAMIVGTIVIGGSGTLFSLLGSRYGLSSNLLSRELFGSYGSAIVTVLYSINYIMFYAFEGAIMTSAVEHYFPTFSPLGIYIVYTLYMFALTIYGMTSMSRFMWISLPIYILSIGLLLFLPHAPSSFSTYGITGWLNIGTSSLNIGNISAALATVFALITMSTQGADYGRMLRQKDIIIGSYALGFGVMFITFCVVTLLGSYFSAYLANSNPGIYFVNYLGFFGLFVVILTQTRINMVNMYSGSLALTNTLNIFGFKHLHFVRPLMALFIAVFGVILIAGGILDNMLIVLTIEGLFIMSWGGAMISYYWLSGRPLIKQPTIDKASLNKFEITGMLTLVSSLGISLLVEFGIFGANLVPYAAFINLAISLVVPVVVYKSCHKYTSTDHISAGSDPVDISSKN